MELIQAINPKFPLYKIVRFYTQPHSHKFGYSKGTVLKSSYNPMRGENIYFVEPFIEEVVIEHTDCTIKEASTQLSKFKLKLVRTESELLLLNNP